METYFFQSETLTLRVKLGESATPCFRQSFARFLGKFSACYTYMKCHRWLANTHTTPTVFLFFVVREIEDAFLPARRYAGAVLAVTRCLSVSVHHKSIFCRSGRTDRAGFWHGCFIRPIPHCVIKIIYSQKNTTFLCNFALNSGLDFAMHGTLIRSSSIVATCSQLSSTKLDASRNGVKVDNTSELRRPIASYPTDRSP